jgi:predicted choloylglycine hydrolase
MSVREYRYAVARMAILFIVFFFLFPFPSITGQNASESDRLKTVRSLEKLDDFPLYVMRFYGDYNLPKYSPELSFPENMRIGIPSGYSSLWACTCFSAKTEQGSQILGRNFDWSNHPALLLFTDPPNRYASVSMVDISYLGYVKSDALEKNPGGLLRSPLLPFDGMNEQGLAVGMMAVPSAHGPDDPQKQTVGSLLIIRLMLDYAKNVDEAIAIFENFNIDFQGGPPLHYFITDKSGRSVVVEFVSRKISVLRNTHPWQVATNFIITGLSPENSRASCWRYKKVWETLENQVSMFTPLNALSLLKDVSQGNTIWSVVYDTSSLDFQVVMGKKFDQVHEFNLKQAVSGQ